MMTRYKSAFAVPSGFAVASRLATKGKTIAVKDGVSKASSTRSAVGRSHHIVSVATPVRAA